jgi:hypothetical protein
MTHSVALPLFGAHYPPYSACGDDTRVDDAITGDQLFALGDQSFP